MLKQSEVDDAERIDIGTLIIEGMCGGVEKSENVVGRFDKCIIEEERRISVGEAAGQSVLMD